MKLKKKTRTTTEYWYELEYCCKDLKSVREIPNSEIKIYPTESIALTIATTYDGVQENFEEPKYSGLELYGRKMKFCPFCGEKLIEE